MDGANTMSPISFTELRNTLMDVHGWSRRVASLASRLYLYVDTMEDHQDGVVCDPWGKCLLNEAEYDAIIRAW